MLNQIGRHFSQQARVLDLGCGVGLLSNSLADRGYCVTGVDLSYSNLHQARQRDTSNRIHYQQENGYALSFEKESFEVVCAMDILEHVEKPLQWIREASRVLKPGGLFIFHTFNRSFLSRAIVIHGLQRLVQDIPTYMHTHDLFIKPHELRKMCSQHQLNVTTLVGFRPRLFDFTFWKLLFTRTVPLDLSFTFTKSLSTGYCGFARKR